MNPFNRAFRALLLVPGVVFVVMATPTVICAAQGDGGGGGDNTAAILGALYGDLYVLERDGNGEPFVYEDGACTGCLQPIAANCSYVPLMCHSMTGAPQVPGLPEDEEAEIYPMPPNRSTCPADSLATTKRSPPLGVAPSATTIMEK